MPTSTVTIAGITYRVRDGSPERRAEGEARFTPMRPRDLLALPATSEAWIWLREHGVRRPSPSGGNQEGSPWRSTPNEMRHNQPVKITLPPETREAGERMAAEDGLKLSGLIKNLIDAEAKRRSR